MNKRELLLAAYRAFNARDLEAALSYMHPDVDWANGMEGGWVHGREDVRLYWMQQWTTIDPLVEPLQFSTDETDQTIVDVHQVVRDLNGNVLADKMVQHIYLIEDGLIRRMEIRKL